MGLRPIGFRERDDEAMKDIPEKRETKGTEIGTDQVDSFDMLGVCEEDSDERRKLVWGGQPKLQAIADLGHTKLTLMLRGESAKYV